LATAEGLNLRDKCPRQLVKTGGKTGFPLGVKRGQKKKEKEEVEG
jgi:hypothetical protein